MTAPLQPDYDDISLVSQSRIDEICLRFEDAWRQGGQPVLEDFLDEADPRSDRRSEPSPTENSPTENSPTENSPTENSMKGNSHPDRCATEEDLDGARDRERNALFSELLMIELEYRRQRGLPADFDTYRGRFPCFESTIDAIFHQGSGPVVRAPYESGKQVGRYVIQDLLGQGSFGSVYVAWDEELQRTVAIKAPRAEAVAASEGAERIIAEARAAGGLQHRSIVPVYDVLHDDEEMPLIVMEHVQGPTLRERMEAGPLATDEMLGLLIEIAEAIDYAHREGFVHRDLEPGNVVLDEEGKPRILDFGLALHISVQSTRAGESAGSLAYMSPEQVRGESNWLDGRADVWALGVMLYEFLTGQCPFQGDSMEQLLEEILARDPRPPRQIDSTISSKLEQICLKCLNKLPSDRYATAGDLAAELRSVLPGMETVPNKDRIAPHRKRYRRAQFLTLISIAVTVLLGAGSLGWWVAFQNRPSEKGTDAMFDLRVWNLSEKGRLGLSARDGSALPLREGDLVRIHGRLSRPLYTYLLWIDSEGNVSPIYPWSPGDWTQRLPEEERVELLSLPSQGGKGWPVQNSPSGMESVVLLAREKPLPLDVDLRAKIGTLRPQTGEIGFKFLELKNGRPGKKQMSKLRSVNLAKAEAIEDAVLANQQQIANSLGDDFCLCYSINFSIINFSGNKRPEEKNPEEVLAKNAPARDETDIGTLSADEISADGPSERAQE